jgi:hypothetical protein
MFRAVERRNSRSGHSSKPQWKGKKDAKSATKPKHHDEQETPTGKKTCVDETCNMDLSPGRIPHVRMANQKKKQNKRNEMVLRKQGIARTKKVRGQI